MISRVGVGIIGFGTGRDGCCENSRCKNAALISRRVGVPIRSFGLRISM